MWFEIEQYPYWKHDLPSREELESTKDTWKFAIHMCRLIWAMESGELVDAPQLNKKGEVIWVGKYNPIHKEAHDILIEAMMKLYPLVKEFPKNDDHSIT